MKYLDLILKIPHDKLGHMVVGLFIYSLLVIFIQPITAIYIVVAIAAIKEIIDYFLPNHTCDILDFVATITLPVLLALIFYIKNTF